MLLSEAHARSHWCPQARIARREIVNPNAGDIGIVGGCNRDALGRASNPASCRCLGSECMAWRWAGWRTEDGRVHDSEPVHGRTDLVGFCGLAGTPAGWGALS
ncbi:hypothetical protein [Methylobacterium indicum]|uniref:hypothetical protein n=1 Tax=Methylobacterium indicum TaxID=1775910 RepID=UPI000B0E9771|nr:hypothetical protein [Methylobacterium indicum]